MKITPERIDNADEIVAKAETYADLFMDYPESEPHRLFNPYRDEYDLQDDRYHVLHMGYNMPGDLEELIVKSLNLSDKDCKSDIRINRYDAGDYLQPRLNPGRKGIVVLTSSERDGLTVADDAGRFRRITDSAGTYIVTDRDTWHWVDPVRGGPRYTIVSDAPFRGPVPVRTEERRHVTRAGSEDPDVRRPNTTGIIARGATGKIYETEHPAVVLKTCWRTAAYDAFLSVVADFPSPHLPVIHRATSNPDGRQWVEMERLWPLGDDDPKWPLVNAFAAYCHAVCDRRRVEVPAILTGELAVLADKLGAAARRYRHSLDLSYVNIMVRPETDEIVVIDPFW